VSVIEELESAIATVAERAGPSIVGIGRRRRGSGVVIANGAVLTNAHNLRGDEVTVGFADGRSAVGRVSAADFDGDVAVVAVDTADAPAVAWAGGEQPRVGTVVFGAAATSGGGTRMTVGTVSSVARAFRGPGGRRIAGSIEHTAPLAPGSSGGALLDADGGLLGINTNRVGEGFYLALPADAALRERVDALSRGQAPARPRLGVAIAPSHVARRLRRSVGLPEREGLLVRGVEDVSAASRAGIREGDLIVAVGATEVTDGDALLDALAAASAPFQVSLVRGTEDLTVTVDATDA